jgi:hypothetical protein
MWFASPFTKTRRRHRVPRGRPPSCRPAVERLEDRTVPGFLAPVDSVGTSEDYYVVGDFNNDSRSDLVSHDRTAGVLKVRLSNGDGTFQPPLLSPAPNPSFYSAAMQVADFNADGNLDVLAIFIVPNFNAYDQAIHVYLGNGDGTFRSAPDITLGTANGFPQLVASFKMGDLNNDGRLDLVAIGRGRSYYLNVLMCQADGSLKAVGKDPLASAGNAVELYDFNGDRKLDAICGDSRGSFLYIGRGDGRFRKPTLSVRLDGFYGFADVNSDGKVDLRGSATNAVTFSYGNGDGTFQNPQLVNLPAGTSGGFLADFNRDGKLDILTRNYDTGIGWVLLGNGDGTFQPAQAFTIGKNVLSIRLGDFDGDGWLDLLVGNSSNQLSVVFNDRSW